MANQYNFYGAKNLPATASTRTHVPASSGDAMIISLILTNVSASPATISVDIADSSGVVKCRILHNGYLPSGSNINILNDNSRLVLKAADRIYVTSSVANSIDVAVSVMEII